MKKSKKFVIVFIVVVIIIILSYLLYSFLNSDKQKNKEQNNEKDKVATEVQFLENKFLNMFNSFNNIQYENYRINSEKISSNNDQEKQSDSSSTSEQGAGSGNGGSSSSSEEKEQTNSSQDSDNINKYNLTLEGVLNNTQDINWDNIKNQIELLYSSIPTITLDLYHNNLNKNDILEFNKEFDELAIQINNSSKENALKQLSKVYSYLPKFVENTNVDKSYKTILNTKSSIFKAYSILDSENWEEMNSNVDDAIKIFSELLVSDDVNKSKQYSINKSYIMLNELKNAVNEKNKEIFLIKYRNLLEEISNI